MAQKDDAARRKFLGTLVDALGDRWVVGYAEAKTFGVIAATLRCEGVEGFVRVVPSVVANNVITWKPFPGTGRPHFDIKVDGTGHQRTCILEDAVGILRRWAAAKAPVVRGKAEQMLPIVRPALEAIAAAPLANVEDAIASEDWSLTPAGKKQLAAARKGLDTTRIARAFPRDDQGRLLPTRALLAPVQSTKRLASGREVFLAVVGPRTKREGDRLELALVDAIDVNETHRWMDAPWSWRSDVEAPVADKRAKKCAALLDAGELDKALAMYGITLSDRAIKVLEGVPTGSHSSHEVESRTALRRVLWSMAPWRLGQVGWGSIALLPHQHHQVKGWIAWHPPATIDIDGTASNTRLARCTWARDVDWDLARLGIERSAKAAPKTAKVTAKVKPQKSFAEMIAGKELWKADTAMKYAKARPSRDAIAELFAIADGDGKPVERANAIWIAIAIADAADGATFAKYLHDASEYVRRMGIEGVKRLGYTAAIPVLATMVCDSFKSRRMDHYNAATAMKTLSGRNGPSGLLGYFASEDPRVRQAACIAFEMFDQGREMARPYLEKMLSDDDAAVVAAAKSTFRVFAKRD